ncbi:MAG TPA: hypothetical protein GX739_00590 [Firmicutes bacterium]|nr:hypothetical protein [Bacillota bacterium]
MASTRYQKMLLTAIVIVLIVYNVVVFLLPFPRHYGFWVGYSFSLISMLFTAAVSLYVIGREGLRSKFYGVPLVYVACTWWCKCCLDCVKWLYPFPINTT